MAGPLIIPTTVMTSHARHQLLDVLAQRHPDLVLGAIEQAIQNMIVEGWPELPGTNAMAAALEPLVLHLIKAQGAEFQGCVTLWRDAKDKVDALALRPTGGTA